MDTINAAMLLASFKFFPHKIKKLKKIRNFYDRNLDKKFLSKKLEKKKFQECMHIQFKLKIEIR